MALDSTPRVESRRPGSAASPRIAVVHDWLTGMRGGERVLEVICAMYPNLEIFTAFLDREKLSPAISEKRITASSLNRLPGIGRSYRHLLPLYPLVSRDLSRKLARRHREAPFDVVVSVSHCLAKNVRAPQGVPHFCYCLTPVRYLWDQYQAYFGGRPLEPLVRLIAAGLRRWDVRGAGDVTTFSGISEFVCRRIERCYGRSSKVIYPPVPTEWLEKRAAASPQQKRSGFLLVNALVPYKNTHVVIEAFNRLKLPLTIVGSGPERARLEALAGPNVCFRGTLSDDELSWLYRSSEALIFAAEEDFGMTPVEMQACGGPVIAYGRGGALETVCVQEGRASGVLFSELTADSLAGALRQFLDRSAVYTVENCMRQARLFSRSRFESDFEQALKSLGVAGAGSAHGGQDAAPKERERVSIG